MKKIVLVLLLITVLSCKKEGNHKQFDKLEKMNWLIGNWENKLPDGLLVESWKKDNDSTYSGNSYFINTKDTVHFESIILIQKEDELIYTATVPGQNDDEPVDFKMTLANESNFTFENPTHDYPQKITYKKINPNNLVATISGKQQGKETQESYPMKRK
jgi:hypothetical protein